MGMVRGVRMEVRVEETGLVLWWVGDKEMMVLGSRCGLVARRRGWRWVLKGGLNLLRELDGGRC